MANRWPAMLWVATATLLVVTCRSTAADPLVVHLQDGSRARIEWSRGATPGGLWVSSGTSHTRVLRFTPWEHVAGLEWRRVTGNSVGQAEPAPGGIGTVVPSNATPSLTDAERAQRLLAPQPSAGKFVVGAKFVGQQLELELDLRDETGAPVRSAGALQVSLVLQDREIPRKVWTRHWQPHRQPQTVRLPLALPPAPAARQTLYVIRAELRIPGAQPRTEETVVIR